MSKTIVRKCMAEIAGTFLFMVMGLGSIAGMVLNDVAFGQWEISIIWGISVAMGAYLAGGISGAHLNPSVTFALAFFSDFPKKYIIPYVICQFLGAFLAAVVVYFLYQGIFAEKTFETASIFFTMPHSDISLLTAFMTELFITALLVTAILAINDDKNGLPRGALGAFLVGLMVAVIGASFGPLTGFALNAARDFGPRLFTLIAGWQSDVMTGGKDIPYCLVPLTAPIIGGLTGAAFYTFFISPDKKQD